MSEKKKQFFFPFHFTSLSRAVRASLHYMAHIQCSLDSLTKSLSHLTPNKTSALFSSFFIISLIIPLYFKCNWQYASIALALLLKFNWTEIDGRNHINKGKRLRRRNELEMERLIGRRKKKKENNCHRDTQEDGKRVEWRILHANSAPTKRWIVILCVWFTLCENMFLVHTHTQAHTVHLH